MFSELSQGIMILVYTTILVPNDFMRNKDTKLIQMGCMRYFSLIQRYKTSRKSESGGGEGRGG